VDDRFSTEGLPEGWDPWDEANFDDAFVAASPIVELSADQRLRLSERRARPQRRPRAEDWEQLFTPDPLIGVEPPEEEPPPRRRRWRRRVMAVVVVILVAALIAAVSYRVGTTQVTHKGASAETVTLEEQVVDPPPPLPPLCSCQS
jgi:hypothetical protein